MAEVGGISTMRSLFILPISITGERKAPCSFLHLHRACFLLHIECWGIDTSRYQPADDQGKMKVLGSSHQQSTELISLNNNEHKQIKQQKPLQGYDFTVNNTNVMMMINMNGSLSFFLMTNGMKNFTKTMKFDY